MPNGIVMIRMQQIDAGDGVADGHPEAREHQPDDVEKDLHGFKLARPRFRGSGGSIYERPPMALPIRSTPMTSISTDMTVALLCVSHCRRESSGACILSFAAR